MINYILNNLKPHSFIGIFTPKSLLKYCCNRLDLSYNTFKNHIKRLFKTKQRKKYVTFLFYWIICLKKKINPKMNEILFFVVVFFFHLRGLAVWYCHFFHTVNWNQMRTIKYYMENITFYIRSHITKIKLK